MSPDKENGDLERAESCDLAKTLYQEMRRLAASKMQREYSPQTLQATALVHEAWLRVGGDQQPNWESRAQYFSAVAEAMRRILVDRARSKRSAKHGAGKRCSSLDVLEYEKLEDAKSARDAEQILDVDEALERFAKTDRESARLLELRFFVGLSIKELTDALGMPRRTVERRLAYAKAWIARELSRMKQELPY